MVESDVEAASGKVLSKQGEGLTDQSKSPPARICKLYDSWAVNGYEKDILSWGYDAHGRVASIVVDHLKQQPGAVLDAGCGTGLVGAALHAEQVRDLVGGDFTPACVKAARERGVYTSVDHLDLNKRLVFDDDQFAIAVSVGVFTYIKDTQAAIAELLRVTKPGGLVLFTQRTDVWKERHCDAIIKSFEAAGTCKATLSEPQPYLPGHPDYSDKIRIIYTTLLVQ